MTVHTEWESYQVAFLVSRGWKLGFSTGKWSKEGRTTTSYCHEKMDHVEAAEFDRDDAYWDEVEE